MTDPQPPYIQIGSDDEDDHDYDHDHDHDNDHSHEDEREGDDEDEHGSPETVEGGEEDGKEEGIGNLLGPEIEDDDEDATYEPPGVKS